MRRAGPLQRADFDTRDGLLVCDYIRIAYLAVELSTLRNKLHGLCGIPLSSSTLSVT